MLNPEIRVIAPAKLNLHLGVHDETDERGYHRVDSVMACVGIHDIVRVEWRGAYIWDGYGDETMPDGELPDGLETDTGFTVICTPDVGVPQESNTCYRAGKLLAERFGFTDPLESITIHVEKNIPDQAGLGASSSDAAATILGLCRLWGIDPSSDAVFEVASEVGADVPFFLMGCPAYLEGAGDLPVESFPKSGKSLSRAPLVLIRPNGEGITAAAAYREFDRKPVSAADPRSMRAALRSGSAGEVMCNMANNLEPIAFRLRPDLEQIVDWAGGLEGVLRVMVTGSGTCFFCVCESDDVAQEVAAMASEYGLWATTTRIIPGGVSVVEEL